MYHSNPYFQNFYCKFVDDQMINDIAAIVFIFLEGSIEQCAMAAKNLTHLFVFVIYIFILHYVSILLKDILLDFIPHHLSST